MTLEELKKELEWAKGIAETVSAFQIYVDQLEDKLKEMEKLKEQENDLQSK